MPAEPLTTGLSVGRGRQGRIGADRIALMETIAGRGSITAAAKDLGLSYRAAWDSVQALNNLFDQPLIEATPGGAKGGEAKVSVIGSIEANSESPGILSIIKIRDSSFVGEYFWNTREGMLRRMNMHQHVVLETSSAGGITLTSDMKTTVTRN